MGARPLTKMEDPDIKTSMSLGTDIRKLFAASDPFSKVTGSP
jgi:hypothetical protein